MPKLKKQLKQKFLKELEKQEWGPLDKCRMIHIHAEDGIIFGEIADALGIHLEEEEDSISLAVVATKTHLQPDYYRCTDCDEPYHEDDLKPNKYEPGQKLCDSCATHRGL